MDHRGCDLRCDAWRQYRIYPRPLWRASTAGSLSELFSDFAGHAATRRGYVRTLRLGCRLLCPLRFRVADSRWSAGLCAAHALAAFCNLQFSRRGALGHGDCRRRIFVRTALGQPDPRNAALQYYLSDCGGDRSSDSWVETTAI